VTSAVPGEATTYTITVTNNGPSDVNNVTFSDQLPGTFTGDSFTSFSPNGATGNTAGSTGNISDTLDMPVGSSVTYTVTAQIDSTATGTLSNTAGVMLPGTVFDPNTGNNSATDNDTLTPQADLGVTVSDGVTTAVPGTQTTYTITVTNTGPSAVTGALLTDNFPAAIIGDTFTSVASGGAMGNSLSGSGSLNETLNMPVGSSVTYTVTAPIDPGATGNLSNTATVAPPLGTTNPTPPTTVPPTPTR
jgi:uncharacterized repeat protein (TIGR01451 family)